jgi:hypothetical protein
VRADNFDRFTERLAKVGFGYYQFVSASMERADSTYTCPDMLVQGFLSFGKLCHKTLEPLKSRQ